MTNTKYMGEKFTGNNNFSVETTDLLIQQVVSKALIGKAKKPEGMEDDDWAELDAKASSLIRLNLGNEVLHNVLDSGSADSIWTIEGLILHEEKSHQQAICQETDLWVADERMYESFGTSKFL